MKFRFFKCPNCNNVSGAGEWNVATQPYLTTPTAKKIFVKIQDAGKRLKAYICPHCKTVSTTAHISGVQRDDV